MLESSLDGGLNTILWQLAIEALLNNKHPNKKHGLLPGDQSQIPVSRGVYSLDIVVTTVEVTVVSPLGKPARLDCSISRASCVKAQGKQRVL